MTHDPIRPELLRTEDVWTEAVDLINPIRQLLVPAAHLEILRGSDRRYVASTFGRWPFELTDQGALTAFYSFGDTFVQWRGQRKPTAVDDVRASFVAARRLVDSGSAPGLRRPQYGALLAALGYWASGLPEPGIVVMPTGTGKTETMLALLLAGSVERLLVIVPTAALRDQISGKFERLGVLQQLEIIPASVQRPVVGRLEHGIAEADEAAEFAQTCNVVVATPAALEACTDEALAAFYPAFSHLFVDEAHHAPARTWARVITVFHDRPVLLFTATPYREDGQALPGRQIFRFPLRTAQQEGYFEQIDFRVVLSLEGSDQVIADLALTRLRADLARGLDHVLMVRARNIPRAKELGALYCAAAADLGPRTLFTGQPAVDHDEAFAAIQDRSCRVVVCVDMLGEGFDLPNLKVAAIHDVKKSLGPMIQFIGRFTRTSKDQQLGRAAVFVARDPGIALTPLRALLREDADWNLLLHDLTEQVSAAAEDLNTFERSFTNVPESIPVNVLEPKMSAIAYRGASSVWDPEAATAVYPAETLLGDGVVTGAAGSVAWFVVEHRRAVRWADIDELDQVTYELIILYFDAFRRLLYIYGSDNSGTYADLAEAVLGEAQPIRGLPTFRVLARLDRLVPNNVGLLDARDHFNRFSMHVGSDVAEAFVGVDQSGRTQTHIATTGFDRGERTTISAALSGRFWSLRAAPNLKAWISWCDEQGAKLLDTSIDLGQILDGFILPVDLTERPPFIVLGLEWPWQITGQLIGGPAVTFQDQTTALLDIEFRVDDYTTAGPIRFSLVTANWQVPYTAGFEDGRLTYRPDGDEPVIAIRGGSVGLSVWINRHKPTLFLEGDRMITAEDRLLAPRQDIAPWDRSRLRFLDWTGVDIRVESQGKDRRPDSIQAFMSARLQQEHDLDLLLDDDRAGEAADLVGLHVLDGELHVTLVHCKYSSASTPGGRVKDLYEVCGQAMRGAKWRQNGAAPLLANLDRRARDHFKRTGTNPYEIGDIAALARIRELVAQLRPRFHTLIAQPGLSAAGSSDEQLRLIAGAENYVRAVTHGTFEVYCSA